MGCVFGILNTYVQCLIVLMAVVLVTYKSHAKTINIRKIKKYNDE
jgi:hypothetical protein